MDTHDLDDSDDTAAQSPEESQVTAPQSDADTPLSDDELASSLRWTREDVDAFKSVSRGKAGRGAFATVAALKARQEIAHPRLSKREADAFSPVVILIQAPEAPQVKVLESPPQLQEAEPPATLELLSEDPRDDPDE